MPPKKPIHQRLGERGSICESIHTSQMKLFRPNKFKAKHSVQQRLGKNYVNPAVKERNRIVLHAVNTYAASNNMLSSGDMQGLNAFTKAIEHAAPPKQKYNMDVQKEISYLQVSKSSIYWTLKRLEKN